MQTRRNVFFKLFFFFGFVDLIWVVMPVKTQNQKQTNFGFGTFIWLFSICWANTSWCKKTTVVCPWLSTFLLSDAKMHYILNFIIWPLSQNVIYWLCTYASDCTVCAVIYDSIHLFLYLWTKSHLLIVLILSSDSILKQNHWEIVFRRRHPVSGNTHLNKVRGVAYSTTMAVLNVNGSVSLVSRGNAVQREGRMSYAEFVWFLISEEDKKNPTR